MHFTFRGNISKHDEQSKIYLFRRFSSLSVTQELGAGLLPLDVVSALWLGEISDGAGVPLLNAVSVLWLVEMPDTRKNV